MNLGLVRNHVKVLNYLSSVFSFNEKFCLWVFFINPLLEVCIFLLFYMIFALTWEFFPSSQYYLYVSRL